MYCSIHQAVVLWDELRNAMEGKHGFGGDTAEIYAYTIMPNSPGPKKYSEDIMRAAISLVGIIDMFRERYPDTKVLINGIGYHTWLKKYGHGYDHRVRVQIKNKK